MVKGLLVSGVLIVGTVGLASPVTEATQRSPLQDRSQESFLRRQFRDMPQTARVERSATDLLSPLEGKSVRDREILLLEYFAAGYYPAYLRGLKPVRVQGAEHQLTFWVMPDYLAVGSSQDFVLIPLTWSTARQLARAWGFYLPTPVMVDRIYEQAERVIWPKTYPPGPAMESIATLRAHSEWIYAQRYLYADLGSLTAGHKKDIVLTKRLQRRPQRIAIYGWQSITQGQPIQPLSVGHDDRYVDYSHGLRLVAPWVLADGRLRLLRDVMREPRYAALLSAEGPLDLDRLLAPPQGETTVARYERP